MATIKNLRICACSHGIHLFTFKLSDQHLPASQSGSGPSQPQTNTEEIGHDL